MSELVQEAGNTMQNATTLQLCWRIEVQAAAEYRGSFFAVKTMMDCIIQLFWKDAVHSHSCPTGT